MPNSTVKERLNTEIKREKEFHVQYWPIFLLETGENVGCCGLRPYDLNKGIYETGFHIRSNHWRKGYASESAKAVIDYAFKKLKVSTLFTGHNPKNEASNTYWKNSDFSTLMMSFMLRQDSNIRRIC